ncbi:hypothetical protein [Paraliomyxa miuraensis]|uniref:hypothetical protein n=1 Tax=Paraliomyxa miuraensis TaxID=376150 RepID=UPI00225312E2|nr:hypothetical protein [Paraliomyxa miuraensis]MCX4244919.1 hypothetical protein [Paraliomyxa miuraensis]
MIEDPQPSRFELPMDDARLSPFGLYIAGKITARRLVRTLWRRRPSEGPALARAEYCVLSQQGEDGIIDHLLEAVGVGPGVFVEFGFGKMECNCLHLAFARNFSGLLMDGSARGCKYARDAYRWLGKRRIQVVNAFVTVQSLDALIEGRGIEGEIDVLSIDVDGVDYWLWECLEVVSPRIVVVEYNASLGDERSITVPYAADFVRWNEHDSGLYHGASLLALERLGERKGYRLVGCDSMGVNAFFLRKDLDAPGVPTLTTKQAFYEHRSRIERLGLTTPQQFAQISHLPFVEIEAAQDGA